MQDEEYRRTHVSARSVKAIRRLLKDAWLDPEEEASLRRLCWAWECGDYDPGYAPPRIRVEIHDGQMGIEEEILGYALQGIMAEEIDQTYAGPRRRRTDGSVAA